MRILMSTRKILFVEKMVKNENITTKMEKKSDRTECGSDTKHILYIITDMLIFKTYQLFLCSFIDGHYFIY